MLTLPFLHELYVKLTKYVVDEKKRLFPEEFQQIRAERMNTV